MSKDILLAFFLVLVGVASIVCVIFGTFRLLDFIFKEMDARKNKRATEIISVDQAMADIELLQRSANEIYGGLTELREKLKHTALDSLLSDIKISSDERSVYVSDVVVITTYLRSEDSNEIVAISRWKDDGGDIDLLEFSADRCFKNKRFAIQVSVDKTTMNTQPFYEEYIARLLHIIR